MESVWISLQITVIGMGLVFGAILLLWAAMALLVRFTREKPPAAAEVTPADGSIRADRELKQRAAAAAVVLALATRKKPHLDEELHEFPLPPTAIVSAWQSVMRTNMLNKRGRLR
jgi:Na+-transporting methylmalonyl-CoA/oxaloacetate decarboxylase gamma subunit